MRLFKIFQTALFLSFILIISCLGEGRKYYDKGVSLMEKKEFQKANEVFSRGIEMNDRSRSINYYGRAYSNYELRAFQNAMSDIEAGLKSEDNNSKSVNRDLYWLKGLIASVEKNTPLEIESYKKAISYAPQNDELKVTLGLALIENKEPKKALEVLNEVIEKNNMDAFAYNNRALAFLKLGDLDKAKSDLDRSKKLDNQNPLLYKNYFFYFQGLNQYENACIALKEALKMDMAGYGNEEDLEKLKKLKKEFCSQ